MNTILDKSILMLVIFLLGIVMNVITVSVIPILIVISFLCFLSYVDSPKIQLVGIFCYMALCFLFQDLVLFLPVICYDILLTKYQMISLLSVIPVLFYFDNMNLLRNSFLVLFFVLELLLKYKTKQLKEQKITYIHFRDTSREVALALEKKNQDLLDKQDYEVNIATLHERNRISMEIHDNVGHLLSSSILQTGALITVSHENPIKEKLMVLNETLSTAMDSIRKSIHNIHDESLQLEAQIYSLVSQFDLCKIDLDYSMTSNPSSKICYCMIAILKEALANIMRHSNATHVSVVLREHPALYQLVIEDDGKIELKDKKDSGIGIRNMESRVYELNGNITITKKNGFRIFVSIPKEEI